MIVIGTNKKLQEELLGWLETVIEFERPSLLSSRSGCRYIHVYFEIDTGIIFVDNKRYAIKVSSEKLKGFDAFIKKWAHIKEDALIYHARIELVPDDTVKIEVCLFAIEPDEDITEKVEST